MTFALLATPQRPATLAQMTSRLIPLLNVAVAHLRRQGVRDAAIRDAAIRDRLRAERRTALIDIEPAAGPIWCESYAVAHERVMDDILGPERGPSR